MFLSRGDRDLGVAFQTHPGRPDIRVDYEIEALSQLEQLLENADT